MALLEAGQLDNVEITPTASLVAFTWNESQGYYEGTGNTLSFTISILRCIYSLTFGLCVIGAFAFTLSADRALPLQDLSHWKLQYGPW